MHYIYQVLAVVLIGVSIGALIHRPSQVLLSASLAAIVLGVIAIAVPSWMPLVVGLVIYLVAQMMQHKPAS